MDLRSKGAVSKLVSKDSGELAVVLLRFFLRLGPYLDQRLFELPQVGEIGFFLRHGSAVFIQRPLIIAAGHELIPGFDVPSSVGSIGEETQAGQNGASCDAHSGERQCEFFVQSRCHR